MKLFKNSSLAYYCFITLNLTGLGSFFIGKKEPKPWLKTTASQFYVADPISDKR